MSIADERAVGKITSGLVADTLSKRTIDFVYRELPNWRDDAGRPAEQAENKLNLQLCKYLNSTRIRNAFPMVHFEHEEYQHGHTSVDISASPGETVIVGARIHTRYDPVVLFEGKRLPAPSQDREKEYVTGGLNSKSGGIQRFKLGLHGAEHDTVAMIGYLQSGSPSAWHSSINSWISDLSNDVMADICTWDMGEVLQDMEEDLSRHTATCQSVHHRVVGPLNNKVLIRHLWVNMC